MTKPTRRAPSQQRSRETVTVLLDAVTRLAVERPLHAIDVNEIARVAGVGIGSVYRYFETKEDLLVAWEAREGMRIVETLSRFFLDQTLRERSVAENTKRACEVVYETLLPLALRYAESGSEGLVRFAKRTSELQFACDAVAARLGNGRVRVGHPEVAGGVVVIGFVQTMFACTRMNPAAARDGRLKNELTDLMVRYIAPEA